MEFKVGDIVRLSESSRYLGEYQNPNSIEVRGVIHTIENYQDHLPFRVDWGEYRNSYSHSDLVLVNQIPWDGNVLKFKFIY